MDGAGSIGERPIFVKLVVGVGRGGKTPRGARQDDGRGGSRPVGS